LPTLGSASEQDNETIAVAPKVNHVARSKVDSELQDAFTHALDIRNGAPLDPGEGDSHLGGGPRVQLSEPGREWALTPIIKIFLNGHRRR
jgi:hypothetical protein